MSFITIGKIEDSCAMKQKVVELYKMGNYYNKI